MRIMKTKKPSNGYTAWWCAACAVVKTTCDSTCMRRVKCKSHARRAQVNCIRISVVTTAFYSIGRTVVAGISTKNFLHDDVMTIVLLRDIEISIRYRYIISYGIAGGNIEIFDISGSDFWYIILPNCHLSSVDFRYQRSVVVVVTVWSASAWPVVGTWRSDRRCQRITTMVVTL